MTQQLTEREADVSTQMTFRQKPRAYPRRKPDLQGPASINIYHEIKILGTSAFSLFRNFQMLTNHLFELLFRNKA